MSIYFEWNKNMSVDEDHIDNQHKKLLSQLNEIIYIMSFGATSREVRGAINFFDDYVKEHFTYEENYMKEHKYPKLYEHKKTHKNFISNYLSFKKKLKSGVDPRELIMEIETYLGQWWIKHISKEDQEYHNFVEKNIK